MKNLPNITEIIEKGFGNKMYTTVIFLNISKTKL